MTNKLLLTFSLLAVGVMLQALTLGALEIRARVNGPDAVPDAYSQASFPCPEDAVLGYSPMFGPNKVGCLNVDDVGQGPARHGGTDAGTGVDGLTCESLDVYLVTLDVTTTTDVNGQTLVSLTCLVD